MKRYVKTLNNSDINALFARTALLARDGTNFLIIRENFKNYRDNAKNQNNLLEANNYFEDYTFDIYYPDIIESYSLGFSNVTTNTGLIACRSKTTTTQVVIYDLLATETNNYLTQYKSYSDMTHEKTESRLYSIQNGKFKMNISFSDENGYYGILDTVDSRLIDYTNTDYNTIIETYLPTSYNENIVNQGYTVTNNPAALFDYIILPYKKYYRFSRDVQVYADSLAPLNFTGIVQATNESKYWYIETPYISTVSKEGTTRSTQFIIVKCKTSDTGLLEVM